MRALAIVSPALSDANNGNWQTARRWRGHLAGVCRARIVARWPDGEAATDAALIALHARRSAASIAAWHAARGARGLAVVLTGTDLYRDLAGDATTRRALDIAQALVVLQERAPRALPAPARARTRVIFQSSTARRALSKSPRHLRALMVGHLREEKAPTTLFAAARLLAARDDILLDHVGAALDPALGAAARATTAAAPNYRWLGALTHEAARRRIQRAHLLVHTSRIEGGAHVIMEAVTAGTPVLASRIDGNIGMLGEDYEGYFPVGDAAALAALIGRCRRCLTAPAGSSGDLLGRLAAQCRLRAALFDPAAERAAVRRLAADLIAPWT
jgi:putative glycosyltransferase (TIGR04348 family)